MASEHLHRRLLYLALRFDMVDICAPGRVQNKSSGVWAANVTATSREAATQLLANKSSSFISPYLGYELGQSWYEEQVKFSSDPQHSHMWLRYANGSVVTCDPSNPSTRGICALLQSPTVGNKVYDWRADGMIDYFVSNISGAFIDDPLFKGIFFDDIYTICVRTIFPTVAPRSLPIPLQRVCSISISRAQLAAVLFWERQGGTRPLQCHGFLDVVFLLCHCLRLLAL
jgi:hypothetical protein